MFSLASPYKLKFYFIFYKKKFRLFQNNLKKFFFGQ